MQNRKPMVLVLAGPNGSGKSTITAFFEKVGKYTNADDIVASTGMDNMEAAILADKMRYESIKKKEDFTFETVLSSDYKMEILRKAKKEGYFIKCVFVLTIDPQINIARIKSREPTDKTVKALNSLHQNGILLCMATGRGYLSIPKFKDITFDVLLTFNGSYVMAGEKIIFRNPLNNNDKHKIIQNLNKMNRAAAISNEHFIVTNGTDEHLEEYFKFGNKTLTIADNFDELCKEDIYQIMCACRKEEYAQILQGTENTQITAWWDKAADIIPLNCGKGNAVNADGLIIQ